jgi:hypothetical protein
VFYIHRVNSISQLISVPSSFGVEIDIRSANGQLCLSHDLFATGPNLSDWLANYRHAGLILNVKESGLEEAVIRTLELFGVNDYLFLDQSFPSIVTCVRDGLADRIAVRASEYESPQTILNLPIKPLYVWCDSFTGTWDYLNDTLKICREWNLIPIIVSPELQGRNVTPEISRVRDLLAQLGVDFRVCTKDPKKWLE